MKYLRGILTLGLALSVPLISLAADNGDLNDPLFQSETDTSEVSPSASAPEPQSASGDQSPNLSKLLSHAVELEKRKDFEAIISKLKPVVGRLPRKGLLILAKAYSETKDPLNEGRTLELCLAKSPRDYYVQTLLGESYARRGRVDEAIAAFQEAKQANPKFERAYEGLLGQLLKTGDSYEARTLLNDMVKAFGKKPKYLSLLCRIYSNDGFLEKAVETCQSAIKSDPKLPDNFRYLGISLKDKEELDHALEVLSKGAKKFPTDEPLHTTLGSLQAEKKNYPAAYRNFKLAVNANAQSRQAVLGLANSAFELQKYDESLNAFQQACTMDRRLSKEFRIAIGKLRSRQEKTWLHKFEDALERCM